MIAKLTGRLDSQGDGWAVIDVGGVGYQVFASARSLARLGRAGAEVSLAIETHVREDHIHLYGFADEAERGWFRLLMGVQGVGAKVALGILSVLTPDALTQAVAAGDKAALGTAPGVGAKLAGRIAAELKDKVGALAPAAGGVQIVASGEGDGPGADAISALVHLGYRRGEASGAVAQALAALGAEAPVEEVIRHGLRELAG